VPEDPARDCYVTPTGCAVCGNPFTGAPTSATAATTLQASSSPASNQLTGPAATAATGPRSVGNTPSTNAETADNASPANSGPQSANDPADVSDRAAHAQLEIPSP